MLILKSKVEKRGLVVLKPYGCIWFSKSIEKRKKKKKKKKKYLVKIHQINQNL